MGFGRLLADSFFFCPLLSVPIASPKITRWSIRNSGDRKRPGFVHRLDRDGDDRVSRREFDGPPDAFDRLDVNRDGYLSESERPEHRAPPPRGTRPR